MKSRIRSVARQAGRFLFALFFLGSLTATAAPEASPAPSAPILEIFEAKILGDSMTQMGYDSKHPLLQINHVRQVGLAQDGKGVLLVLGDEDAKTLARVTREFDARPLMFKIGDVLRPITISGAVEDGKIGFKYPEADALAEQCRRYFHLGEFENPTSIR